MVAGGLGEIIRDAVDRYEHVSFLIGYGLRAFLKVPI
jgi:hypothetical protein